jgi:prepilin-type N-terminal cleavage/methylation domain-containing protein
MISVTYLLPSMNKLRPTPHGFSLVEMIAIVAIVGILAGIAAPSLLSQKKEFRNSVSAIESMLKTVNLSARANSGNPYRISLATKRVNNATQQYLKVDILQNGTCNPAEWVDLTRAVRHDVRRDFMLPEGVEVLNGGAFGFPAVNAPNNQNAICFNGRGETFGGSRVFEIVDREAQGEAVRARITLSFVGDVARKTYRRDGSEIPNGKF